MCIRDSFDGQRQSWDAESIGVGLNVARRRASLATAATLAASSSTSADAAGHVPSLVDESLHRAGDYLFMRTSCAYQK